MPVQWQNLELHLGGIESYMDHPHIQIGKLASLQNGRFMNPPTISKRFGYLTQGVNAMHSSPATIGTPRRVIGFKDEFLMCNDRELWSYAHEEDRWTHRGEVSDGLLTRRKVYADQSRSLYDADIAVCPAQNCMVVAWGGTTETGIGYSEIMGCIIDLNTNTVVNSISFSGTNGLHQFVKVICVNNTFVWFSWDSSSSNLHFATFDSSSSPWSFGTTLTSVAHSSGYTLNTMYDVAPLGGSTTELLLINQAGTSSDRVRVELFTLSNLSTGSSALHNTAEVGDGSVAVCGTTGEDVYIAWSTATQTHARVLNASTLAAVTGILTLDTVSCNRVGLCRLTANSAFAIWERPEVAVALRAMSSYSTISDAGAIATAKTRSDWTPASKPWVDNGMAHGVLIYKDPFQDPDEDGEVQAATGVLQTRQPTFTVHAFTDSSSALLGANTGNVSRWWGTCAAGIAVAPAQEGFIPAIASIGSSEYETALCYSYRVRFAGDDDGTIIVRRGAVNRVGFELASTKRHLSAPWGDDLFIAGARPSIYDGHYVNEHAFPTAPEFFEQATTDFGLQFGLHITSTDITNGTNKYTWCLVWEWQDAQGNVVRSPPSQFITTEITTPSAPNNFQILTTLREHLLRGAPPMGSFVPTNARVVPYRNVKSSGATGPFYRDHSIGYATDFGTIVSIGGVYDDETLVLQDQLYTTGDILDTATTPPCKSATYHEERLWLFGGEDPEYGWFSQPYQEGEQPRFNEALRVYFGEPIVAGKTHGTNLAAFSTSSTFLVSGYGPPATGGVETGFAVEKIHADVGCIEPRSLVWTPVGLMFQSRRGIELLDLGYAVKWIGQSIKTSLDLYSVITSAVYQPASHEVIFTALSALGTTPTRRYIYNVDVDQWSEDVVPSGFEPESADLIHNGSESYVHTYAVTTPAFYQQQFTTLIDTESVGSNFVGCVIVTPWVELNTVQGWQRVKSLSVLFRNLTSGLTVEVAYDYSTSFTETHTWTTAQVAALARPQIEVHLSRQKCEAVRFKLTETGTFGGEGYNPQVGLDIRSLVVRAGFKKGVYKAMDMSVQRK